MPSGVFFCCVSCCSALVNALRAVLSDSVTELSLFRASEMALSFRVCCPSRRACCASRTARAARHFFPALTTACPEYLFCARIQQAYQRPSCLRSAHPSAVFQPVRLTTWPRGRYTKRISISKQHPALCMQPEGIISGDFSTESVFSQLCLQESELLSCNISGICVSGTECFQCVFIFSLAAIAAERRFPASVRLFSFSFCCALSVFCTL